MSDKKGVVLTEEQLKRRKRRSLAIALVLTGLVVLFYAVTIVKLGPNAMRKSEIAPVTVRV
jgi:cell division septal protein FtsQ